MNFIFFLFVTALFLTFVANYLLNPERNPKYTKLLKEDSAPSQEALELTKHVLNGVSALIFIGLILAVPFFRFVAVVGMLALVGKFFYNRHFSGTFTEALEEAVEETVDELSPMEKIDANQGAAAPATLDEAHPQS